MQVSTEHGTLRKIVGEERALRILREAGFEAVDYSFDSSMIKEDGVLYRDDYLEYARNVKALADELGIRFNQAHAPFRFNWHGDEQYYKDVIIKALTRTIEMCAVLGIPCVVIHPIHHLPYRYNEQKMHDMNMKFYRHLAITAKKCGVQIALENMFGRHAYSKLPTNDIFSDARQLRDFYDELNDPIFTICLDVGHATLVGEDPGRMIRVLGDRITALHMHDNCGINDDHLLPGAGVLDYEDITKALAEIHYAGDMTMEVVYYFEKFHEEVLVDAARLMLSTGAELAEKVQKAAQA